MNKFIFYKGKYYTSFTIESLLAVNDWYYNVAQESIKNHRETLDLYDKSLNQDRKNIRFDVLLSILFGVIGIKIGTLL